MSDKDYRGKLSVRLQWKAVLVLAFIVTSVAVVGGWFYFTSARAVLQGRDRSRAAHLADGLSLAAQEALIDGDSPTLNRLAGQFLQNEDVCYVVLLGADGKVLAEARDRTDVWSGLANLPVSVSEVRQPSDSILVVAQPVVRRDSAGHPDRLLGAVRLVLDSGETTARIARMQRHVTVIAVTMVLCVLPLAYAMVWRILVQPVNRLAKVARRFGGGDFSARSGIVTNDEIGELAGAFDFMADHVDAMHRQLVQANEQLERKVAERTGELQATNSRLRDEMAEKEDFLRAVSHDLNAPLRNIAGMATMIMMKERDRLPEEVIARLQRIQANVDAETTLIGELLDLSRVRSRPEKREAVDMGRMLADLAHTFEYELLSRNIALAIASPMPVLHVEKNRMRQVFQNLIDNAIKYMDRPTGGRIEVGYRLAGDEHEFTVTDNGPGIPADQLQKVFYVFRRVEGPTAAKVPGKGVGLSLVKSVVGNYDGRTYVESDVGRGATFHVTLSVRNTQRPPDDGRKEEVGGHGEEIQAAFHPLGG